MKRSKKIFINSQVFIYIAIVIALIGLFFEHIQKKLTQELYLVAIALIFLFFVFDCYLIYLLKNRSNDEREIDKYIYKPFSSSVLYIIVYLAIFFIGSLLNKLDSPILIVLLVYLVKDVGFLLRSLTKTNHIVISVSNIEVREREITNIDIKKIISIKYDGFYNSLCLYQKKSKKYNISLSHFVSKDQEKIKKRIFELARSNQIELSNNLTHYSFG